MCDDKKEYSNIIDDFDSDEDEMEEKEAEYQTDTPGKQSCAINSLPNFGQAQALVEERGSGAMKVPSPKKVSSVRASESKMSTP